MIGDRGLGPAPREPYHLSPITYHALLLLLLLRFLLRDFLADLLHVERARLADDAVERLAGQRPRLREQLPKILTGAKPLQGPHHDAQKSMITISFLVTTSSKFSFVSSTVAMACSGGKGRAS